MERSSTNQVRRDQEHSTGELITMKPEQAVGDVKADVEAIKERAHR